MITTITQWGKPRLGLPYKWLFVLLSIVTLHQLAQAQQPYYNQRPEFLNANSQWAFGKRAGLDFNSSPPLPFYSQCRPGEGAASVADPQTGELLFYWTYMRGAGNYAALFNANHEQMLDGVVGNNGSTVQGCVIVPMIDSPGKYYVFSLYGPTNSQQMYPQPFVGTLFYSVVDMALDNGLGDVVPGQKHILLDADTLGESMIAVPGDNCDIWLMVHSHKQAKFKAYHITGAGIDPNPVVSIAGEQIQGSTSNAGGGTVFAYTAGGMVVSPDRQRLAITSFAGYTPTPGINGLLLCQFDPATGLVSNSIQMEDGSDSMQTSFVPAFSPDNNKLYVGIYNNDSATNQLRQYTISNYDSATIANSKTTIHSFGNTLLGKLNLKLYRDTIYIMEGRVQLTLSTLNQPNLDGVACDYQANSVSLGLLGFTETGEFPNEVVYPLSDTLFQTVLDTFTCNGLVDGLELHPDQVRADYTYTWSDNSADTALSVFENGIYWVSYGNGCDFNVDTFIILGSNLVHPVITVNVFELSTTMTYDSYQWLLNGQLLPGATQGSYTVLENGDYQVIVGNDQGCVDTSEVYEVTNVGIQDPGDISALIRVGPNPVQDVVFVQSPVPVQLSLSSISGALIQRQSATHSLSMGGLAAGMYLLRIMDKDGRLLKVEKLVKVKE